MLVVDRIYTPLHRLGLKIAIADCDEKNLAQVGHELTTIVGESNILVIPTDVSKLDQVVRLRDRVYEAWGEVRILSLILGSPFCSLAVLSFFPTSSTNGLSPPCLLFT